MLNKLLILNRLVCSTQLAIHFETIPTTESVIETQAVINV